MYNIYIKEKRNKEKQEKLIEEEKMKIIEERRQSKQRIYYHIFILI